jgi:hypothetical protein
MLLFNNNLHENKVRERARKCDYSHPFPWGTVWGTIYQSLGNEIPQPWRLIMALTIKEIENAKPKLKKYKMLDGAGLSLLVLPTATKLWLWRYQFNGGEKNMTFGEYPVVGPKEARELHFAATWRIPQGGGEFRSNTRVVLPGGKDSYRSLCQLSHSVPPSSR